MKFNNQNWFLDYVGINVKIKYINDWTRENHLAFEFRNNMLLDQYFGSYFKPLQDNKLKPIFLFYNKDNIRIEFKGAFFQGNNIEEDLERLEFHYKNLYGEIFLNLKNRFCQCIQMKNPTVYRIDIASNIPTMELEPITFTGKQNKTHSINSYHRDLSVKNNKKVTGYSVGNRGRDKLQLRIYLKGYDKNKAHDIIRFGTDDFTRVEYELGTKYIKDRGFQKLDQLFNTKGFVTETIKKSLRQPQKTITMKWNEKWINTLSWCHTTKQYVIPERKRIIKGDYYPKKYFKFDYPNESKYYGVETVKGIIQNKLNEKEIEQLKNYINNI